MKKKTEGVHQYLTRAGKQSYEGWKRGTRGYYEIQFMEHLNKVSDKDISLKEKYALDYLSAYLRTSQELIRLKLKKQSQTLTTVDEVYYVVIGQVVTGKMSIRLQRTFKDVRLVFIYQAKTQKKRHPKRGRNDLQTKQYNRMKERRFLHSDKKRGS